MVDKLIRERIIEIVIVLILVVTSIPVWNNFDKKISEANILTADDCNLEFNHKNKGPKDILTVNNNYHINKKYKIFLELDKNIDITSSEIIINNKTYKLSDFYKETKRNKNIFTIVNEYITYLSSIYEVELKIDANDVYYTYNFEESNNF